MAYIVVGLYRCWPIIVTAFRTGRLHVDRDVVMACMVMAYVVMAYVVMAYTVIAHNSYGV